METNATPRKSPLLSVVVPVYNASATLERCMESLLRQEFHNVEFLCVNDGSTDDSGEILEKYAARDDRVFVFHQQNAGVSAARNRALQELRGRYVVFADADDCVDCSYFKSLVSAALEQDADCVLGGWIRCAPNGKRQPHSLGERPVWPATPRDLSRMPSGVCGHLYAACVVRESKAGFPANIRYGEDTAFHYALYPFCNKYAQVASNGYIIHATENSATSKSKALVLDMVQAMRWLIGQYAHHGFMPRTKECLAFFAVHALSRLRSLAPFSAQKGITREMRELLQQCAFTEDSFACLRPKDAKMLHSILAGRGGLRLRHYYKYLRSTLLPK